NEAATAAANAPLTKRRRFIPYLRTVAEPRPGTKGEAQIECRRGCSAHTNAAMISTSDGGGPSGAEPATAARVGACGSAIRRCAPVYWTRASPRCSVTVGGKTVAGGSRPSPASENDNDNNPHRPAHVDDDHRDGARRHRIECRLAAAAAGSRDHAVQSVPGAHRRSRGRRARPHGLYGLRLRVLPWRGHARRQRRPEPAALAARAEGSG